MPELSKHYHGDKIDCPMRPYRPEFIADIAKQAADRRERAKIAKAGGYTAKAIETMMSRRKKETEHMSDFDLKYEYKDLKGKSGTEYKRRLMAVTAVLKDRGYA
jgi:hypothetical protein